MLFSAVNKDPSLSKPVEDNSVFQKENVKYGLDIVVHTNVPNTESPRKFTKSDIAKEKGISPVIKDSKKKANLKRKRSGKSALVDEKDDNTSSCSDFDTSIKKPKKKKKVSKHKGSAGLKKTKGENSQNKKKSPEKVYLQLRTRTTPKPLFSAIRSLKNVQKKCLISMGFGKLIGMSVDEIPAKLAHYVVDIFDSRSMELKLPNGSIKCTREAVHEMLGVPNGGTSIKSLESRTYDDSFSKQWKNQFGEKPPRPGDIVKKIILSNDAGPLFKMNFLMLFANTMASCESSGTCSNTILNHIMDDVQVESLDWCGFIIDCLRVSKVNWKRENPGCFYVGPVTFLVVSFYYF